MSVTIEKPNPAAVKEAVKKKLNEVKTAVDEQRYIAEENFTATVEQLEDQKAEKVNGASHKLAIDKFQAKMPVLEADSEIAELERQLAAKRVERQEAKRAERQKIRSLSQEFNQASKQIREDYKRSIGVADAKCELACSVAREKYNAVKADGNATIWDERKALVAYNYVMTQEAIIKPFNAAANIGKTVSKAVAAAVQVLVDAGRAGYNAETNVKVPEILLKRQSNSDGPSTPAA